MEYIDIKLLEIYNEIQSCLYKIYEIYDNNKDNLSLEQKLKIERAKKTIYSAKYNLVDIEDEPG
jgi:hypothetical protein